MKTVDKFSGKAQIYEKYRPGYTKECIDYIIKNSDISEGGRIADIGAGTGIFSEGLLKLGYKVVAVEPNDDMRAEAQKKLSGYPLFSIVNTSAENTELEEHSIDLITVAQAFHWFDVPRFRRECLRILKPDKKVFLIWNNRDSKSELVKENARICSEFCPDFTGFSGGKEKTQEESFLQFFQDGKYTVEVFSNNLYFDKKSFIGRNLSASYALKQEDTSYKAFITALEALFEQYQENGMVRLANVIQCYSGFPSLD